MDSEVAEILRLCRALDDADFDHTMDTLQQMKRNRAKQSKKNLALYGTIRHYDEHVEK